MSTLFGQTLNLKKYSNVKNATVAMSIVSITSMVVEYVPFLFSSWKRKKIQYLNLRKLKSPKVALNLDQSLLLLALIVKDKPLFNIR